MPADHLTTRQTNAPADLAVAVLAVLAGDDPATVAANHAVNPADLRDAVGTYQAAGLAALQRQDEGNWYQVRVQFRDWSAAETVGATALGPALDRLRADGATAGWWFLRKHPCWRLRLARADVGAVNRVLDDLTGTGVIARWWSTLYEPETAAFGGSTGMDTIHDLFCADSAGVLDYVR
ncbi:O-methyltransferase clustered with LanBC [Alloactinosynnema sp. L-07]|nr:O-methyltransferase clustered with LanBC [Alloactinosynnema sp. L-07]